MKVSVNWLKQFLNFDLPPVHELVEKIGAQLGAIEEVENLGEKYQGIIVVKVVECVDHPNADRLRVCKVDDGGKAESVDRDEQGYVQVVCGAPNVHAGMLAAWLPPGATVPSTVGKEPFVLDSRDIRGQKSNGMMASPKELGISDNHEGILDIDKDAAPGSNFAELFRLDDYVIDIENKMFTHRPDCFGALGVAREIAGILQQSFQSPDWYKASPEIPGREVDELKLEVQNELPELVPRFTAITMSGVEIKPSPIWLQIALMKVGQKSINNIVDLTNFWMLVTGQPLHAYDYDKVKALSEGHAKIVVRYPKPGEKIKLLNGKEAEPRAEAIMIATDKQLIGVGGVMGGGDTEVDNNTKNIIIECANFDMYSIRRTSMAHGLFTDAATRFTKGQSPLQTKAVLAKIVDDIRAAANGKIAGELIDDNHLGVRAWVHPPVPVAVQFINDRLGFKLSADDMKRLLENVEFQVTIGHPELDSGSSEKDMAEGHAAADWIPGRAENDANLLTVTAPFWRTDIETREDVVEEVGRLYGYDHLPLELPIRDLTPATKDPLLELKAEIRNRLSKAGANEVLAYSFVHGNLLDKVGQDKANAYKVANALSPDLQYYRLSLIPSLLEKIHSNIKAGYDEFALFELGKTHSKDQGADEDGAPLEQESVALVLAAADKLEKPGAAFYVARRFVESLAGNIATLDFEPIAEHDQPTHRTKPFAPDRSALVRVRGGSVIGIIGEFKPEASRALKLPRYCAGFELDITAISQENLGASAYMPLSRFPKVTQDITLKIPATLDFAELHNFISDELLREGIDHTQSATRPLSTYQRPDDPGHKQVTFRVTVISYERTLTDTEVTKLLDQVADAAKESLNAERV